VASNAGPQYEMGHTGASILVDNIEQNGTFSKHRILLEKMERQHIAVVHRKKPFWER
jgi:hypothetical protein